MWQWASEWDGRNHIKCEILSWRQWNIKLNLIIVKSCSPVCSLRKKCKADLTTRRRVKWNLITKFAFFVPLHRHNNPAEQRAPLPRASARFFISFENKKVENLLHWGFIITSPNMKIKFRVLSWVKNFNHIAGCCCSPTSTPHRPPQSLATISHQKMYWESEKMKEKKIPTWTNFPSVFLSKAFPRLLTNFLRKEKKWSRGATRRKKNEEKFQD